MLENCSGDNEEVWVRSVSGSAPAAQQRRGLSSSAHAPAQLTLHWCRCTTDMPTRCYVSQPEIVTLGS